MTPPADMTTWEGRPQHGSLRNIGREHGAGGSHLREDEDTADLLEAAARGDTGALDAVEPVIRAELHAIIQKHVRCDADWAALDSTDLLHEAYLVLVKQDRLQWQDSARFLAVAARIMRDIFLFAAVRRRAAGCELGELSGPVPDVVCESDRGQGAWAQDVVALDEALRELEKGNSRAARVVDCRYVAGLDPADTARALGISEAEVASDWAAAREWLSNRLEP